MLADKNHVKRDTCWGLVELLPELHMERAYEDHELLVENLLMWKVSFRNSRISGTLYISLCIGNKIVIVIFVYRPIQRIHCGLSSDPKFSIYLTGI